MMRSKAFSLTPLVFLAVMLTGSLLQGQSGKPSKLQLKADEYFTEQNYVEAENLYKEVLNNNPNDFLAAYRLGRINSILNDYQEALRFYRRTTDINPSRNDTVYYYIGTTYKTLGNFRQAKEAFNEFMRRHKRQDDYFQEAEREIKGCDLAESFASKLPDYRVKETSFNSPYWDYFHAYLDQRQDDQFLVFSSHRPVKNKNKKSRYSTALGQPAPADLYLVVMEDDSTFGQDVYNMGKRLNSKKELEGASSFSQDGLTIYYTITEEKTGNASIYVARYDPFKKRWSKPELVPTINGVRQEVDDRGKSRQAPTTDIHPFITKDGRTIFFASDRDGGFGGMDIWFARRVGNGWSEPINAGSQINTAFNEITPYLNPEGTRLYFASSGHIGMGGYDLFYSDGEVGNWKTPVNPGPPVNSTYDDLASIWSEDDSSALFTSNRLGGTGGYDVYWARAIFRPEPPVEITLQGKVRDKQTKLPIQFATVILFEETNMGLVALDTFKTDQSARYQFKLESAKTYRALGNAPEYFANEVVVQTPDTSAELERNIDIELDPVQIGVPVALDNIYYDFDEYYLREDAVIELTDLVALLQKNPNITIELGSHTDSNGSRPYNKKLSENRARAAVRYLIDNGIQPNRITWMGYGEDQLLINPEITAEDEQINRRTEFRVRSIYYGE
jgi:outer membrane protein OmpA-like peptidoglycan-associated protein/tetratricopeptide (TPR) repeat protein